MAMPPAIPNTASSFSDEKYRSAINPTKKGEIIDPIANAPYANPTCWPLNFNTFVRYVPRLIYHAPQMKYWRNMNTDSFPFSAVCMGLFSPADELQPNFHCLPAADLLFNSCHLFARHVCNAKKPSPSSSFSWSSPSSRS